MLRVPYRASLLALLLSLYGPAAIGAPRENSTPSQAAPQATLESLQKALEQTPDDPRVLSQLGYALVAADRPEDAVAAFDRLIVLNPKNPAAYNGKAVAFDHAGNHLAAQELYQQALKLSPDSVNIQNNLGMSLILNGQIEQAIALLQQLNDIPGAGKTVRQNLALAYGIHGDKDKALALNLKDLPEDEAKENMRFYEEYVKQRKLTASDAPVPSGIGFADTPASISSATAKEVVLTRMAPAPSPATADAGASNAAAEPTPELSPSAGESTAEEPAEKINSAYPERRRH